MKTDLSKCVLIRPRMITVNQKIKIVPAWQTKWGINFIKQSWWSNARIRKSVKLECMLHWCELIGGELINSVNWLQLHNKISYLIVHEVFSKAIKLLLSIFSSLSRILSSHKHNLHLCNHICSHLRHPFLWNIPNKFYFFHFFYAR